MSRYQKYQKASVGTQTRCLILKSLDGTRCCEGGGYTIIRLNRTTAIESGSSWPQQHSRHADTREGDLPLLANAFRQSKVTPQPKEKAAATMLHLRWPASNHTRPQTQMLHAHRLCRPCLYAPCGCNEKEC